MGDVDDLVLARPSVELHRRLEHQALLESVHGQMSPVESLRLTLTERDDGIGERRTVVALHRREQFLLRVPVELEIGLVRLDDHRPGARIVQKILRDTRALGDVHRRVADVEVRCAEGSQQDNGVVERLGESDEHLFPGDHRGKEFPGRDSQIVVRRFRRVSPRAS